MFKIKKKKKGMTLLEVIISIAILGIMIVPMSNMILTSVRTNKRGEDKQQAVYLAQQVIEALKNSAALEDSHGFVAQTFPLNDTTYNLNVVRTIQTDPLTVGFNNLNIGNYMVKVSLGKKQNESLYENTATNTINSDYQVTINGDTAPNTVVKINNGAEVSANITRSHIYVYLNNTGSDESLGYDLVIKRADSNNADDVITHLDRGTFNGNLSISFGDTYTNTAIFNIDVFNNLSQEVKVYVKTKRNSSADYVVNNQKGVMTTYDVVSNDADIFSKNYNATVEVLKDGQSIYTINSNISK